MGVTFILSASATAVMNSWKTTSLAETQNATLEEHKTEERKEEITEIQKIERPRDYDGEGID